jgi:hypothetical protein
MSEIYEKDITQALGSARDLILLGVRADADIDYRDKRITELRAKIALLEKACEAAAWFYDNLKYPIRRDYKLEAALRAAGYGEGV